MSRVNRLGNSWGELNDNPVIEVEVIAIERQTNKSTEWARMSQVYETAYTPYTLNIDRLRNSLEAESKPGTDKQQIARCARCLFDLITAL